MYLLEALNLEQNFRRRRVLKDITLRITSEEIFALIGPTGSGKSTLIRLLDLLEVPSSGQIFFAGTDVTSSKHQRLEARRRMAYVQQKPFIFAMSVFDNIAYGLKLRHVNKEVIRDKVENMLNLVDMVEHRYRNAKTLSGGETQRIAIARALITDPELLFLDEPTANLDPISKNKVEEVLAHAIREHKTTVVMTTHDMSQGQRLAGRIGVLIDGEILQVGSPNDIFCLPYSKEVAEFIGIENILSGTVIEKDGDLAIVQVNGEVIQVITDYPVGDKVNVLIRPEDITITVTTFKDISSARNLFKGKITRMNPVGTLVRIEIDCGFKLLSVITSKSAQELSLKVGNEVYASFKATALYVIKRWN
jgi:tungstate transport system ATP-binding protein